MEQLPGEVNSPSLGVFLKYVPKIYIVILLLGEVILQPLYVAWSSWFHLVLEFIPFCHGENRKLCSAFNILKTLQLSL